MAESNRQRIALSTGVSLDVVTAGDPDAPAMLFLHGFPESHRTWRHQIGEFARDHFVVAPDQRGFARSDKPPHVDDYRPEKPVGDAIAGRAETKVERTDPPPNIAAPTPATPAPTIPCRKPRRVASESSLDGASSSSTTSCNT